MKKLCTISVAVLLTAMLSAQDSGDTLTFESFGLDVPDSAYYGQDEAAGGQIPFNNVILSNYYEDFGTYDTWSGFAISNHTDDTTAGFGNQFSAFAGSGSNSDNYGVFYSSGTISFTEESQLLSLELTNVTYAAISMRDGDAYAKQFGSIYDANGDEDGTNGEDFFLLKIIPLDESQNAAGDTIDFYLADYRFADSTQDYILQEWTELNLETENIVANSIKFELSSSDNGDWGMNTPAYFAVDNIRVAANVGIGEVVANNWNIYPNPALNFLQISTETKGKMEILNTAGKVLLSENVSNESAISVANLSPGAYIIRLQTENGISTKKLLKQ